MSDLMFHGVRLEQTCLACPEQYDAFFDGAQIGYFRQRYGKFTAEYPDVGGTLVYMANTIGNGSFDESERTRHLKAASIACLIAHGKYPQSTKPVKQVIVMRDDLGMTKGKMVAQGAHASCAALFGLEEPGHDTKMVLNLENDYVRRWVRSSFTKICVRVTGEQELNQIIDNAQRFGIPHARIVDDGRTMFKGVPTLTCGSIGPWDATAIDALTGHMKLF